MPFELISSEVLVEGRAFKVRRDTLKTPDGHQTKLEIVEHGGSVVLLPIDSDGNLLFVHQYRHAVGRDLMELPAGTRDGEEPFEECAAREIREGIVRCGVPNLAHLDEFRRRSGGQMGDAAPASQHLGEQSEFRFHAHRMVENRETSRKLE